MAKEGHLEQKDLNGEYYINHVQTVVDIVKEKVKGFDDKGKYIQVAWMHDLVEDTEMTLENLRELGFEDEVVNAVEEMSNNKGLKYEDYIKNIDSDYARVVKMADLKHNLDIKRLGKKSYEELTKGQKSRVNKYNKALECLSKEDEERRLEGIYRRVKYISKENRGGE